MARQEGGHFHQSYLNALFIVDSADHLYTHLCDFWKRWLFQTDIPQDLYYPLSYTNTSVL